MADSLTRRAYVLLTEEGEGRACRDIPEEACREQPTNFLKHVVSLTATKTGDGLADPKLVLSWLLTALGAPPWQTGLLVPIREAGSLLPQLAISAWIRKRPVRKWIWTTASLGQGVAVLGMAGSAIWLEGGAAGGGILGCLAGFALFRAAASVSYKDVLGKTLAKSTRGTATGTAASLASAMVLLFGVLISVGTLPRTVPMVVGALLVAAALWVAAALVFATLAESEGATEGGENALRTAMKQFGLVRKDPQLARFIGVRGLLLSTALAPPYFLMLAGEEGNRSLGDLGAFVVASAGAAVLSAFVWGRLADASSRRVLRVAGMVAGSALAVVAGLAWWMPELVGERFLLPALLFVTMVAYQGVRIGRSTHVVDMVSETERAAYVAISNTAVGGLLLLGSVFGWLAQAAGEAVVLGVFALLCAAAAWLAHGLEEVQA
jgi:hypothetical protein